VNSAEGKATNPTKHMAQERSACDEVFMSASSQLLSHPEYLTTVQLHRQDRPRDTVSGPPSCALSTRFKHWPLFRSGCAENLGPLGAPMLLPARLVWIGLLSVEFCFALGL
jgi:hypothetical protein